MFRFLCAVFAALVCGNIVLAQEYSIESFEFKSMDLSARTEKRLDFNGYPCAMVKVLAIDRITKVNGNVVGDIVDNGAEKWIYVKDGTKQLEIVFEKHLPLHLSFGKFGYECVESRNVYLLKLKDSAPAASANTGVQQTAKLNVAGSMAEAEKYYNDGYYDRAFDIYKRFAESGHIGAQNWCGYMYEFGKGVSQDYGEAVRWYRKSAEQGNAYAQNRLGVMCDLGKGVSQDYNEAVRWYRKSAEQGNASGQCNLGYMYNVGKGVSQDYNEAVRWYRKSAEQGNAYAQFNLGTMYEYGIGVTKDYNEAMRWYRKAADQGHENAKKKLANAI